MKTLEFISDWMSRNKLSYEYDDQMDVVRVSTREGKVNIYTCPDHNLFCISHSEPIEEENSLTNRELTGILAVLQETVMARPVPRTERGKIKFKIIADQKPEDIPSWIDNSLKDMSLAINIYRSVVNVRGDQTC